MTTASKPGAYKHSELRSEQLALIDRVGVLAREKFAARAPEYDRTVIFPSEDFADLFNGGVNAEAIPKEHGGLGLGPYRGDVFTLWMMTKEIAKADLSFARGWEGQVNSMVLLDGMVKGEQRTRWFDGVVKHGDKWVAWSGEPQARKPGEKVRFGTSVERVDGGYVIDGNKVFSTSASGAQWAILLVNTETPGGVRHATASSLDAQLLMACELSDPTIEVDSTWWDPIRMRATVSYLVNFRRTFIPDVNLIGYPGQYLKEGWQTCFIPHYAATFLGAAEAAYDYALAYLTTQNKVDDPYVQHHIGQMSVNVETAHLWLRHVARLWETEKYQEAQIPGSRARHVFEHLAANTVKPSIPARGPRCLHRPTPP